MLHGIGGSSIEEAKETLSYDEVMAWGEYIRKRGTLNLGLQLERGFALIATAINRANGGKAEMEDFMPHLDQTEVTLEDAMRAWK